jgi:hypothetical protein
MADRERSHGDTFAPACSGPHGRAWRHRRRGEIHGGTRRVIPGEIRTNGGFDETFGLIKTGTADIITPNRLKPMLSKKELIGWSLP